MVKTKLMQFVLDDVAKYKDTRRLVRAGLFEQRFRRSIPVDQLHPNPEDEFCDPEIGPNDEIISRYKEQLKQCRMWHTDIFKEPVLVQKMLPDGYMLINGHHRWAAAVQMGEPRLHTAIVNPRESHILTDEPSGGQP